MKKKGKRVKAIIILIVIAALVIAASIVAPNALSGRGVSASAEDIKSVVQSVMPYLIVIGCFLIALFVVFAFTKYAKTRPIKRFVIRWHSLIALLVGVTIVANLICLGPISALLNVSMSAKGEMTEGTRQESYAVAKQIVEEGIILLKNENGALPLSKEITKLNVFGWSSTNPIYGGTGSGAFSDTSKMVTLLQGLQDAGYELNQDLIDFYAKEENERPEIGMYIQDWTVPEAKIKDMDRKNLFEKAKEFSDTAVLVLSRSGGEGADLPMSITDENTIAQAATTGQGHRYTSQKDDVDPTKHYLELTNRERELVGRLNEEFQNIIVIINSANTMELGWVNEYENIKGVIWCAGAGQAGFEALGDVLNGSVNPSGKTVDTYLYDLLSSPTAKNIGDFEYDNTYDLVNTAGSTDNLAAHFVNYVEGIYVGYKFYETAADEGLIDYASTVQYPFGYGLSYTTFTQELKSLVEKDGTVTLQVNVTNTGKVAGKDVVEVYYKPPYTNEGIEKASVNLIEFAKTDMLEPGASQQIELSFALEDMASYDEKNNKCYVLEKGDYEISIRSDSHTVIASGMINVGYNVIYGENNPRSSDKVAATNLFDYASGDIEYLSRANGFANYATATAAPASYSMSKETMQGFYTNANYDVSVDTDPDAVMPITGAKNGLKLKDLSGIKYGDAKWDTLLNQLSIKDMSTLVSMGGYMTSAVNSIGLDATIETDGPSGLHSNFTELEGTSFPSPVMIASTWNKELAKQRGEMVGKQGMELGISGWYGPAMNIHRSAFSGRNFEYYSEDAVLSGVMAANETEGARKYNMQTYVKHFALNDQESNRTGILLTWSNEQAIREIYLKPFEMTIKEGEAKSVMSSYNYIGNKWAGANKELLEGVLRGEWGFEGCVVTDWFGGYGYMNADLAIRNGGDRMLTTTDMAKLEDTESATAVTAMRKASHDILYSLANSSIIADLNVGMATWMKILYIADAVVIAIVVLLEWLFVIKLKKKRIHCKDTVTDNC